MSRYRKIDPRIWNDAKFNALSDEGKLVFFMLLTHPTMTALGAMRATMPGLAAELGWNAEAFRKAFGEVCEQGMAEHDTTACFVWLPNFLGYNKPESPNVVRAWRNAVDLLPECTLKTLVLQGALATAKGMSKGFLKAFDEALPEVRRLPIANQEPEQEQEPEPKKVLSHERQDLSVNTVGGTR
ncbi:hypothetical protein [Devosia sp. 2618]|uniref:hypothetical protein n=1 Tax=Devosia sp. 2618 TaxID=3156454 RepID=UPI00339AB964